MRRELRDGVLHVALRAAQKDLRVAAIAEQCEGRNQRPPLHNVGAEPVGELCDPLPVAIVDCSVCGDAEEDRAPRRYGRQPVIAAQRLIVASKLSQKIAAIIKCLGVVRLDGQRRIVASASS